MRPQGPFFANSTVWTGQTIFRRPRLLEAGLPSGTNPPFATQSCCRQVLIQLRKAARLANFYDGGALALLRISTLCSLRLLKQRSPSIDTPCSDADLF